MKRNRKTKILATLGPATSSEEMIEKLFIVGADVFRINMSHTTHDDLKSLVGHIRKVEEKHNRPIGILVDLQGPKLRIGEIKHRTARLKQGQTFVFDKNEAPGDDKRVYLPHEDIFDAIETGNRIFVDDGRIHLEVKSHTPDTITTQVQLDSLVSSRKGVSLPDTILTSGALTDKDRVDLQAALDVKADWLALSFIQRPEDVKAVRALTGESVGILAKLEKPQAVQRLEGIIAISDAVMVARGDLGVEMPLEQVPVIQKRINRAARDAGVPVVVATQMLESMISSPVPTRAEVSDVATAVFEGADAVMLSAESAMGDFPEKAIEVMNNVCKSVETNKVYHSIIRSQRSEPKPTSADALAAAARQIAETLQLQSIVCYTKSGSTGLRVARERPGTSIIALSPVIETMRRLSLVWGIHCVQSEDASNFDNMVDIACSVVEGHEFAVSGERIIITAGMPFGVPGKTNLLRVAKLP